MKVVTSPLLASVAGVRHAFFTRHGGASTGVYDSLNLGQGSSDDPAHVAQNRRRAAAHFGVGADGLLTCYQIHSADVITADGPFEFERPKADGIATATPGLVCGALSADCAPVLICDPQAGVVAAAHAGWRGALGGVIEAAVAALVEPGARPEQMVAAVGPCIGPRSYEVGLEFEARFVEHAAAGRRFFAPGRTPDKRWFDLPAYALDRLAQAGVTRCEWVGHDTCAEPEFFSNRRAVLAGEADYGRLLSAIMLEQRG